jgi:two-component system OmpR family response regulator
MVLQILMRREGELITTQNLLDTAWGYDFEGDPNVVQAYISRLRRAIDRPFNVDSIKTIRGVGYRLVPVTVRDMS